jgi:putative phosphoesterase
MHGVQLILHAGDVGGDEILDELSIIAPVHAVSGNTDDPANPRLRAAIDIVAGGVTIHVSHGHELGSPKPEKLLARYAAQVIVYGHTHEPRIVKADGRLVVNPGAAGPARFDIKPSAAILEIRGGMADARIVNLP